MQPLPKTPARSRPDAVTPASSPPLPCPCPVVAAVLERGVTGRFFLYPDHGPARRVEQWRPPALDGRELAAVEARLAALDRALTPAGRGELLARVLALLSHYRLDPHPAAVEMRIADDWAEDLAPYPLWAIDEAARAWRRSRKFKPQVCEIIELCEAAVGDLLGERDRLRQAADRARADQSPHAGAVRALARGLLQPMPGTARIRAEGG